MVELDIQSSKQINEITSERVQKILEFDIENLKKAHKQRIISSYALLSFYEPLIVLLLVGIIYFLAIVSKMELNTILILGVIFWRFIKTIGVIQSNYQIIVRTESGYFSRI